jgi:hypothetical protein
MSDRLTIEIFGLLHGTAEGPLAVGALVFLTLVLTRRLWCRRDVTRLEALPPPHGGWESPNQAHSLVSVSPPSRDTMEVLSPRNDD